MPQHATHTTDYSSTLRAGYVAAIITVQYKDSWLSRLASPHTKQEVIQSTTRRIDMWTFIELFIDDADGEEE